MSSDAPPNEKPFSYRDDPNVPAFADSGPVLVFDGDCILCSRTVAFVLKHDQQERFIFVAAQTSLGAAIYRHYGLDSDDYETFIVLRKGRAHFRSDAALRLLTLLGFPWSLGSALRAIPRPLRDRGYGWVARNRYRIFGRRESCYRPTPDQAGRFIS